MPICEILLRDETLTTASPRDEALLYVELVNSTVLDPHRQASCNMPETYTLGVINDSRQWSPQFGASPATASSAFSFSQLGNTLTLLFSVQSLWTGLLVLFLVLNLKNLPFMWHMRIVNAFRFILRTQRPQVPLKPCHIFQPIITTSQAQLMEIDFNMHKTNSSYFSDVDIARTHLVCTLFAKGIEQMRGGTEAYTGSKQPVFGLALGAVSCNFRRELRPYESYEMWSRILSWDEKWVYIVTHFVRKGAAKPKAYSLYPDQGDNAGSLEDDGPLRRASIDSASSTEDEAQGCRPDKQIYATALSKCVFKSGRKTVAPELMLRISGLLPASLEDLSSPKSADEAAKLDAAAQELREIEFQRRRGMKIASQLAAQNQQALEEEFRGGSGEVLGRHTDGAGIGGVVSTLLQLARLKKSQLL